MDIILIREEFDVKTFWSHDVLDGLFCRGRLLHEFDWFAQSTLGTISVVVGYLWPHIYILKRLEVIRKFPHVR